MSWPLTNLDDLLDDIQPGFASGQNESDGVLQVRMNNVKPDGSWDWSKERRVPATLKQLDKYSLQSGDILFNTTNSPEQVGKSALFQGADEPVSFSNHFLRLRVKKSKLSESYLTRYFAFLWQRKVFENMVDTWVNQATVQRDSFLALKIPLPPLAEQKRIAAILDKADILRRKNQQAIQLADQFLRAVFLDLFGKLFCDKGYQLAYKKPISELTTYIDYRGKTPEKSEYGVPLITAKNVKKGYVSEDPREYIPESNYEIWMTRGQPLENDVLFTTEAPLGNVALLGKYEKVAVGQRLVSLRSKGELTQEYLLFCLLNPFVQNLIEQKSSGSTAKGIRTKELWQIELPIPDIKEQNKFSVAYKKAIVINRKNALANYSSDKLFNSLSQKAFAGEL